MNKVSPMPQDTSANMILMMIGSLIGHLVFGVFVAWAMVWITKAPENVHRTAGSK